MTERDAGPPPSPRRDRLAFALPPLLAVAIYAQTVGFGFVWDDAFLSLRDVYATGDVGAVLTGPGNGVEYLPVRDLTLIADFAVWGRRAAGFHATNVALFALAAALLLALQRPLWRRTSGSAWGAPLLCTLAVVAHPLQVEPVAWVTGRNALLALLFSLATAVVWVRHVERGGTAAWALSLVLAGAACLSKASALSLPFLLPLIELRLRPERRLAAALGRALPHVALAVAIAALHFVMAGRHGAFQGEPWGDLAARLPRAAFVPVFYLWKTVWPTGLTMEYDLGPWRAHPFATGAAALATAAALALVALRGHRERSLGWLFALGSAVALVPVSNLLPTFPTVADRYAQLALVWAVPLLLLPVLRGLPARVALAAACGLVVLLAGLSFQQARHWRDDTSLFSHAVAVNPGAGKALGNLAMKLWDEGRRDEAEGAFRQLAELDPLDYRPTYARGLEAFERGDLVLARAYFEQARAMRGASIFLADVALGAVHEREAHPEQALEAYRRARARLTGDPSEAAHRADLERRIARLASRR